ncbi:hypothetical protein C8R45DRAFT_936964 [Mycena sanguinolenta]|nr:hypothetical protein C8R45DRAFT_936964 [Mycena sanguinolenta]
MSRARPEALKPAKPGPFRPGQARPDCRLVRAQGLGLKIFRPGPARQARAWRGVVHLTGKLHDEVGCPQNLTAKYSGHQQNLLWIIVRTGKRKMSQMRLDIYLVDLVYSWRKFDASENSENSNDTPVKSLALSPLSKEKYYVKARAQAQARPGQAFSEGFGLGLEEFKARARPSQAQARAFRPSRALDITIYIPD